jgi:hypothetical protein
MKVRNYLLAVVFLAGIAVCAFVIYMALTGRLSTEPATDRELVDRLESRMGITSINGAQNIYVADRRWKNREISLSSWMKVPGIAWREGTASIQQFPTAKEATEAAEAKNGFAHGRFVLCGHPDFVKEIRRELAW